MEPFCHHFIGTTLGCGSPLLVNVKLNVTARTTTITKTTTPIMMPRRDVQLHLFDLRRFLTATSESFGLEQQRHQLHQLHWLHRLPLPISRYFVGWRTTTSVWNLDDISLVSFYLFINPYQRTYRPIAINAFTDDCSNKGAARFLPSLKAHRITPW